MSNVEQFGKYLLLEKIAAGGMAEVYLAKATGATGLNKFFAIKRILPQFSSNDEFVEMFKEEANVAINLNHNNVVSIFDFGIERLQFYLVMDYVEGKNLRQIINELKKNNKSFTIDQSLFMVKEAAAGLDHAHRCTDSKSGRPLNITHRDMSPQNIMVSYEGEVKVIDFGIAKSETEKEETKAGILKGKFSYMSPEQAEGQPIDPRTDVFALGIVLWELLANDRLFTGSNEATILRKVRECQIPSIRKVNPTVSPELERIVMKALAKDRNVRYQTAANLHRDLNRYLNTQFPDFSPQDFSQFIKESFKTAYQEGRDKLVTYSSAKAPTAASVEATITEVPKNVAAKPANDPVPEPQVPPGFNIDQQVKINLDGVLNAQMGKEVRKRKSQNEVKNHPGSALGPQKKTVTQDSHGAKKLNKTSFTNAHNTRLTRVTQVSYVPKNDELSTLMIKFAIILFLGVGGLYGYNNFLKPRNQNLASDKSNSPVENGQIEMAATASVKVSVKSSPDGATILLDGKDTGYSTPAIISVTANQKVVFTLRKDSYLEYEIAQKYDQTSQINATLQPTARAGFLNIYLSNGGPTTKVFVNGKELAEKTPIMKYPILADREALIRAYNPITQLSDEVRIKLSAGENKNIELILGRNKETIKK